MSEWGFDEVISPLSDLRAGLVRKPSMTFISAGAVTLLLGSSELTVSPRKTPLAHSNRK